jgi:predicted permease
MIAFVLLIVCLALGIAARFFRPPPALATALNWWVITISLPALVLHSIAQLQLRIDMWYLIAAMWLVFFVAWGFFALIGRALRWTPKRIGALTLTCGLGNTAFVGYPMIEALRGKSGLALAVVADQIGCFVMLAVGGAVITSIYSDASLRTGEILKRIALFPSFLALLIAVVAHALGGWPLWLDATFSRIGDTLVPIALFSVGLQVRARFAKEHAVATSLGLFYKLVLAPLMIYAIGRWAGVAGLTLTIGVLQAAMAPMISAAILAEQNDMEPQLSNWVLVAGILLSFATVPIINSAL